MKFGALLRTSAEDSPELQGLFVCYKQLKKKIKQLPGAQPQAVPGQQDAQEAEASFVRILNADVHQFNHLFIEREEDCVIRLGSVEEAADAAGTPEEIALVYRRSVNLHGQLLLMVHWSILAYTGLVKILKKHNKRTGAPIQAPHLDNLLSQPFCSVELLSQLVRKTEATSERLADQLRSQGRAPEAFSSRSSTSSIDELILAARSSVQELAADTGTPASAAAAAGGHPGDVLLDSLAPAAKRARTEAPAQPAAAASAAPAPAPAAAAASTLPQQPQPQAPQPAQAAQPAGTAATGPPPEPAAQPAPTQQPEAAAGPQAAQPAAAAAGPAGPAGGAGTGEGRARAPASSPSASGATILRQTQAALGLWESLHGNAATPSTVLQPHRPQRRPAQPPVPAPRAQSVNDSA